MAVGYIPKKDDNGDAYAATKNEADIGDFKMACAEKSETTATEIVAELLIPGTAGVETRLVHRGETLFNDTIGIQNKDRIVVDIYDKDNIFGFGAGAVLGYFYDEDAAAANQGHYFTKGKVDVGGIGGYGDLVGGLYLRMKAVLSVARTDTLLCNIHWIKPKVL